MSLLVASKFGIAGLDQSLAGLVSDLFLKKIKEILAKIWLFWMIGAANKNIKIKKNKRKKITDNHGHILRHFDVWPNITFTTNERKHDY